jgi:hypothetical protein
MLLNDFSLSLISEKNMESLPVVKKEETEDEIGNMSSSPSSYFDSLKDTS